jgi:hypothetical protein
MASHFEHGNELFDSIKGGTFLGPEGLTVVISGKTV